MEISVIYMSVKAM